MSQEKNIPTIAIFGNFFIDNEERFLRLCDSFTSFYKIQPLQWVICVRGSYKEKVASFLRENIIDNLSLFFKPDKSNWFKNSREMLGYIHADLVMFWIEDHICLVSPSVYSDVLKEFYNIKADELIYSWWHNRIKSISDDVDYYEGTLLNVFCLDNIKMHRIEKTKGSCFYPISAVSVMRFSFFKKILFSNRPYLKRWPQYTPFDFEKKARDNVVKSFSYALPKIELFASIDDDHGVDGYSLISRGLYPCRLTRREIKDLENMNSQNNKYYKKYIPYYFIVFIGIMKIFYRRILYTFKYCFY